MKRLRLILFFLLIFNFVLAACVARPTAAPVTPTMAPAMPIEEPTEVPSATPAEVIIVTYWEQEGDDVDVLLDELSARFMEANPRIRVERVHFTNEELRDQFQMASLAGEAPVLVRAPNEFAGPFSELGIILPVTEIYDQAFLDQFFVGALEAARVKGKIWGAPDNYGYHLMLIYNRSMVTEVPTDTDAWLAQLKGLANEAEGKYGLVYNLNEPFWLVPWLGGFGAWPLDENDQPSLNTQGVVAALQFVHDLKFVHKVVPPEANYTAADTLFKEGNAAYLINGDWSLGSYKEFGLDFGVAALPKVTPTGLYPTPMASAKLWMFSKLAGGLELDAAAQFVAYMTSAEAQTAWLEQTGRLPSNREASRSSLIAADPILAGSMAQLSKSRGLPAALEMRCAWDAMRPDLEEVMAGTKTPTAAAQAMQDKALQCVAEMKGVERP